MESIAVVLIGGNVVARVGAIASNPRSRAAIELKIDELTPRVESIAAALGTPISLNRVCPWSGATLTRFCDELAWGAGDRGLHPCVAGGDTLTPNACTFGLLHNE